MPSTLALPEPTTNRLDTRAPAAARGRLGWLFVLASLVAIDGRAMPVLLPSIAEGFDVRPGAVGWSVTTYTIAYGALQLAYGPLSDRYGRLTVVRVTTLLFVVGVGLSAMADSLIEFTIARLFTGAFAAAMIPTAFAHIGDTVSYADRQTVIGQFGATLAASQVFALSAAGLVSYAFSWRMMFLALAILTVAPIVLLGRTTSDGEADRPRAAADYLPMPKRFVKKFFTLEPNDVAPSFTFWPVDFASGSAALPASLSFSPVNLAPSTTVLPMPFAVSSTPWPTLPSPIFFAPVSTCCVADFTLESSAAVATPATPSENTPSRAAIAIARMIRTSSRSLSSYQRRERPGGSPNRTVRPGACRAAPRSNAESD